MAQTDAAKLDVGDPFPALTIRLVGTETPLRLPADLSAQHTILLGYRGKW